MRIVSLEEIKAVLPKVDLIAEIEAGFAAYSRGDVIVPPVGEMHFDSPPGDVHIKYGYIKNDEIYVIKIASGFWQNTAYGLPNGNGMMLVFNQKTGQPVAVLQDEGYLTDVRTAVAGAVCAKFLAPKNIERIGILGTGLQAKMQLKYLDSIVDCKKAIVWGRSETSLLKYQSEMNDSGYAILTTRDMDEIIDQCQLIVTCTASEAPLISRVNPGTHITAMGSDTKTKQELDASLLSMADLAVADSRPQCEERGEIHQAMKVGFTMDGVVEVGEIIAGNHFGRTDEDQITIADLIGVAVQDIQISKAVLNHLN
ncbi:MAG: ornithine cyclodeaminase family protein [Candidatus Marinimicrobia bacterium]|jgi:ornithine cyclodeaminase|nr:ornithine cyclodeaminase family protein [Candidatus Neomarinimicrobiota bacterium]MDP6610997.1 ornithine cyclodeaminase family protein [Candidatus Neomarinimicrobiota bacterium]|tara:strand:- start:3199 stop:4134 length:936 start_codon:yes stop_codon:yes gene_type:complete